MKAILQRVTHAKVTIDGQVSGEIGTGFLVLLGVAPEDTQEEALYLARKIAGLRVFTDENDKMKSGACRCRRQIAGCQPIYTVCRLPKGQATQLYQGGEGRAGK